MRAAFVRATGPADSIEIGRLPAPTPGPTDVLVAVDAVPVNPVDTFVRSGRFPTPIPLPFVLGRDLVGTVVEAPAAGRFRAGDRVWCNSLGHDGRQGSFAELAVVPTDRLYPLPDGVDAQQAVAVVHPAATAYLAWFVHARLQAGETVFVGGGAGNVGRAAIALAVRAGARVIASARAADHDLCRTLGADMVLDFTDPELADQLADAAPDGVATFWETSGHHDLVLAGRTTAPGGRVLLTAAGTTDIPVPVGNLYARDIDLLGFVISRATVAELADAATMINRLLPTGQLAARVDAIWPLERAADAHRRMEQGSIAGRLLLTP